MGSDTDNDVDFSATSDQCDTDEDQCDTDDDVDFSATSDRCVTSSDVDFSASCDEGDAHDDFNQSDIDLRSWAKNHVTNVSPRLYQG